MSEDHIVRMLRRSEDFPHEIGLFLGYPLKDVVGFMELGPCSCKCTGCWKVYGNEEAAKKKFAQYKNAPVSIAIRFPEEQPSTD